MATVDFSAQLERLELEEGMKERSIENIMGKVYLKSTSTDVIPGCSLEVYADSRNLDDYYLSPRSALRFLGFSPNWLNTAYSRPRTLRLLEAYGFSVEKKKINVRVQNTAGLTVPSVAISKADMIAIMEYGCYAGKIESLALRDTFLALGLLSVAGLASTTEETRQSFGALFKQRISELEASNVSK